MPWLPQLLTIFRSVLRTAADGPNGATHRNPSTCSSARGTPHSADHGAGSGAATAATIEAAATAALGMLNSASRDSMKGMAGGIETSQQHDEATSVEQQRR